MQEKVTLSLTYLWGQVLRLRAKLEIPVTNVLFVLNPDAWIQSAFFVHFSSQLIMLLSLERL